MLNQKDLEKLTEIGTKVSDPERAVEPSDVAWLVERLNQLNKICETNSRQAYLLRLTLKELL